MEGERLSGVLRACGGDVEVLLDKGEALVKGKNANLTPKEFRILALLASRPGEVFTSQSVIEHVWGMTTLQARRALLFSFEKYEAR